MLRTFVTHSECRLARCRRPLAIFPAHIFSHRPYNLDAWNRLNREFKQWRFWSTHVNRKWAFFFYKYTLTLPNLYFLESSLLKRRFVQEFVRNHGLRVQKRHFWLSCIAQKLRQLLKLPDVALKL